MPSVGRKGKLRMEKEEQVAVFVECLLVFREYKMF